MEAEEENEKDETLLFFLSVSLTLWYFLFIK